MLLSYSSFRPFVFSIYEIPHYFCTQNDYLLSLLYHFSHLIIHIYIIHFLNNTYIPLHHFTIPYYLFQPFNYNTSYYLHTYILYIHHLSTLHLYEYCLFSPIYMSIIYTFLNNVISTKIPDTIFNIYNNYTIKEVFLRSVDIHL